MKLLIFGVGVYYDRCKKYFDNHEIVGLLDNNIDKIGNIKDGVMIVAPLEGIKKEYDKIFILTPNYIDEIKKQLLDLGVEENKIFTLYDIKSLLGFSGEKVPVTIYSNDRQYTALFSTKMPNIAVMTNSLGINGGDMTVLYVVKILVQLYNVHVISKMDGPLRRELIDINVPVIIDESIMIKSFDQLPWIRSYDLIFANGMMFYGLFDTSKQPLDINAIWWIHSSGDMNNHIPVNKLNNILQRNVSVYGVSNRAIESFKKLVPSWSIKSLCYGLESKVVSAEVKHPDKIIFAMVGTICKRKAQDLFLDAIRIIPENKKKKCEFWIIGSAKGETYADNILKHVESLSYVKYWGCVDNDYLLKNIYPKINVLVCPSLEDTMPIVCAEAMMYSHPCIVSENTGTAQYIMPQENGLIVKTGERTDLANKIEWMIDNAEKIDEMGKSARRLYEECFSMEQFKQSLISIVENKLKGGII